MWFPKKTHKKTIKKSNIVKSVEDVTWFRLYYLDAFHDKIALSVSYSTIIQHFGTSASSYIYEYSIKRILLNRKVDTDTLNKKDRQNVDSEK